MVLLLVRVSEFPVFPDVLPVGGDEDEEEEVLPVAGGTDVDDEVFDFNESSSSSSSLSLVDSVPEFAVLLLDSLSRDEPVVPVPDVPGLEERSDEDCELLVPLDERSSSSSSAPTLHGAKANAATIAEHNGARLIRVFEIFLLLIIFSP